LIYPEKLFSKFETTPTGVLNALMSHNFRVWSPETTAIGK